MKLSEKISWFLVPTLCAALIIIIMNSQFKYVPPKATNNHNNNNQNRNVDKMDEDEVKGVVYSNAKAKISGNKFFQDGRPRQFKGNTIIFHLAQQGEHSEAFNAILDIYYRELPKYKFIQKFGLLPSSSLHVTLFGGLNERDRNTNRWPQNIPKDTPIEDVHKLYSEKLQSFKTNTPATFRFKVDLPAKCPRNPLSIALSPFDEADNKRLRKLRDDISRVVGIRDANHSEYRFHISIAYIIDDLKQQDWKELEDAYSQWRKQMLKKSPVITVTIPEYCYFSDMFSFNRLLFLSSE